MKPALETLRASSYPSGMTQSDMDVPEYREALAALRALSAEWPGVTETLSWGNPTLKANGKNFAVLDHYQGSYCVWVRCAS